MNVHSPPVSPSALWLQGGPIHRFGTATDGFHTVHSPLVPAPAPGGPSGPLSVSIEPPPAPVETQPPPPPPPPPFPDNGEEACTIPDVVFYTPPIAREAPIAATVHFSNSSANNPCQVYLCTVHFTGGNANASSVVQEDTSFHKWLLSPHVQGELAIGLDIEIGNSCDVFHTTATTTYDSISPRAVAAVERHVKKNGTTFTFHIQFSEPVQPIAAEVFNTDIHSKILEVINLSSSFTRVHGLGKPGTKSRIVLQGSEYRDLAGNYGAQNLTIEIDNILSLQIAHAIKRTQLPMATTVTAGIAVSAVASTSAAAVASTASSGSSVRSNVLRSSLHLQFLAMTSSMAAPALSETYKELAQTFSWTGLTLKGSPWGSSSDDAEEGEMEKTGF